MDLQALQSRVFRATNSGPGDRPLSINTIEVLLGATSLISVFLAAAFFLFFFNIKLVTSPSMAPTLEVGETIISRTIHKHTEIHHGDIAIFSPYTKENCFLNVRQEDRNDKYIKRVVGLPGDTIAIKDNILYVNGNIIEETYLSPEAFSQDFDHITVPDGYYFLLGDNRLYSYDSREFGCIPVQNMSGIQICHFDSLPLVLHKLISRTI